MTRSASRALSEQLPESVAAAVLQFLTGDLLREPRRVGHELTKELTGTWSARRGTYRILYEIDDDSDDVVGGTVRVTGIAHRRDVYRR